jgi:phospholipase C
VGAGATVGLAGSRAGAATTTATERPGPGQLPNPKAPAGADQLPEITAIVSVMIENHTYDSILGKLHRGDGFHLNGRGHPTNSNPWPEDSSIRPPFSDAELRAFPMPNPCQPNNFPYNTWKAGHTSFDHGRMDGFVKSQSGPVAMGYYDSKLIPFVYSLASVFPVCDRWFSSVMAQTYPNRRFYMAGTSLGLLYDVLNDQKPPNGTIFEMLNRFGISWRNYYSSDPSSLIWTYLAEEPDILSNLVNIDQFFSDAAAGTLPGFSLVDPNFNTQSEEDPQDVQFGDVFLSQVIHAVMDSPQWPTTMLVWTYDEGGGYYDHVPPPSAVRPDDVSPMFHPGDPPGRVFNRYGFRVPSGVVSPRAKPGYVSHRVHDHTSVLKLIETKWNLPALTRRDATANDLLDSVDLTGPPHFLRPPKLAAPPDPTLLDRCLSTGPGAIPPPGYVIKR